MIAFLILAALCLALAVVCMFVAQKVEFKIQWMNKTLSSSLLIALIVMAFTMGAYAILSTDNSKKELTSQVDTMREKVEQYDELHSSYLSLQKDNNQLQRELSRKSDTIATLRKKADKNSDDVLGAMLLGGILGAGL